VRRQDERTAAPRLGLDSLPQELTRAHVCERWAFWVKLHIHSSVYLYTSIYISINIHIQFSSRGEPVPTFATGGGGGGWVYVFNSVMVFFFNYFFFF